MLLQVCVNGARRPGAHPALPITAADLAQASAMSAAAGAQAVHLHVKDVGGRDTLATEPLRAVLHAVRKAVPGLPVGVTTGEWALPDPLDRVVAIRRWAVLPDFASVNWHERGAEEVAGALLDRGIAVEAGLWHEEAVAAWAVSPLRDRCLRALVELPDGLDEERSASAADRLWKAIRHMVGDSMRVLLHGEGTSAWPALRRAAELGLATRIGLEDTLVLPDGSPTVDNADLVRHALGLIRERQ